METSVDDATAAMPDYYLSVNSEEVQVAFQDFDEPSVLHQALLRGQSSTVRNFIIDFSDDDAWVAFDLAAEPVTALLQADRPVTANTRWINIWSPSQQGPLLDAVGKHYDFSPRLLALICSDPSTSPRPPPRFSTQQALWRPRSRQTQYSNTLSAGTKGSELSDHLSTSSCSSARSGDFYALINEVWHYTSIDFGRNYICMGYNTLHSNKHGGQGIDDDPDARIPYCKRVWTWLMLCADNTVIMIHEDPFPDTEGRLDPYRQRILAETRRNVVNVFRSLSTVSESTLAPQNPMVLFPIRRRLGDSPEETAHRDTDAPGMLFFYLFENWHNNYTLVTRRESRYGADLEAIRREMFISPQLCHIDRLDRIGGELGVLKRHYQSYERLIDRLLEPREPTAASLKASRMAASQASIDTVRGPTMFQEDTTLGVLLSSAAVVRFERMKDLINTCALSELEDYLKAKDSLIAMNFNLSALRQNQVTERLTQVGLLITKSTVLFLPVSLMSAYFSINLGGVDYTVADYWIAFTVVLIASWLALCLFGVVSGTMETMNVFRSGWRRCTEAWVRVAERVRMT